MKRRGRPAQGAQMADSLSGSQMARERLKVIMRTVSGELTIKQACEKLGIGKTAFYALRNRALEGALSSLEPGKAGRPRLPQEDEEKAALKAEIMDLRLDLEASRIREELAIAMPHVLTERTEVSKKKKKKKKDRRGGRR